MTTANSTAISTYTLRAIPAETLAELRRLDDAGKPMEPYVASADGVPIDSIGSPLRCCLRSVRAGERIALVAYAPLRRWAAQTGAHPGAYDEVGPTFIHADECRGPVGSEFPFARPGALRTIRCYDPSGYVVGGSEFQIPEDAQAGFDQVLSEAFSDPQVVLVHVRALEYGCFQFEVRR